MTMFMPIQLHYNAEQILLILDTYVLFQLVCTSEDHSDMLMKK